MITVLTKKEQKAMNKKLLSWYKWHIEETEIYNVLLFVKELYEARMAGKEKI